MFTIGLWIFIAVVAIDLIGLIYDAYLYASGKETITAKTLKHPWIGVAIIAFQLMGVLGIAAHFIAAYSYI